MKESDFYEKLKLELIRFMREEAQDLDYPVVQKKLHQIASRCWCSIPETADSETAVMDNFFYLSGWLESRISLKVEQHFKKRCDGVFFSHQFKEIPMD